MKRFIHSIMVVLALSAATLSMTGCEEIWDDLKDSLIGGSVWYQEEGDYTIEALGGCQYKVTQNYHGDYWYFYLEPFYTYQQGRPHNLVYCEYYPYYSYSYQTLGWRVRGNSREWFITPNGNWH